MQPDPPYRLRPLTAADEPIVEHIFAKTRGDELAMLALEGEQRSQFFSMQATAQLTDYRNRYPDASYDLVEFGVGSDAETAGRLFVDRRSDEIWVLDLALLPKFQGTGLGTELLEDLKTEASARGVALRWSVLTTNTRAAALYERLGFVYADDLDSGAPQPLHRTMEWLPRSGV